MIERIEFEKWYIENYWNFRNGHVTYDVEKDRYNHFDVDLAWNAWCAGLEWAKGYPNGQSIR